MSSPRPDDLTTPTPDSRHALTRLAYWHAQHLNDSNKAANATLSQAGSSTSICPLIFAYGGAVQDFYLLPKLYDDEQEPLTLWAQKVAGLPFHSDKLQTARGELENVQPLKSGLKKLTEAQDAALLPSLAVLKKLALVYEARLARQFLSGRQFEFDPHSYGEDGLACHRIDLAGSRTAWAHYFVVVSLMRKEKKGGALPVSLTRRSNEGTETHQFSEVEGAYPAPVVPELSEFPTLLSLAVAVAAFLYKIEVIRGIDEWQEDFRPHIDVARYVRTLLNSRSIVEFVHAHENRPQDVGREDDLVDLLLSRAALDPEAAKEVRRTFPTRAKEAADAESASQGHDGEQEDTTLSSRKKQQPLDLQGYDDDAMMRDMQNDLEKYGSPSKYVAHCALEVYQRASDRLAVALERVFDEGRVTLTDLSGGWQQVYTVVGGAEASTFDELRGAKGRARALLRRASGEGQEKKKSGADDRDEDCGFDDWLLGEGAREGNGNLPFASTPPGRPSETCRPWEQSQQPQRGAQHASPASSDSPMSSPITSNYLMGLLTGKSDPNDFYKRYPNARPYDSDDERAGEESESESQGSEGDESPEDARAAQDEEKQEDEESEHGPARKKARVTAKPEEMDDATLKRELEAMLSHHTSAKGPHPNALPLAREHYERASDHLMSALARLVNNGPVSLHSLLKGWTMIYSLVGESEAERFDELRRAKRQALVMVRRAEGRADWEVEEGEDDEGEVIEDMMGGDGEGRRSRESDEGAEEDEDDKREGEGKEEKGDEEREESEVDGEDHNGEDGDENTQAKK